MITEQESERLWADIKSLVLNNKMFPVEGYEFPQERVAGFWKEVFEEKGISVFGIDEAPVGVNIIQTDFLLPDEPPGWLIEQD